MARRRRYSYNRDNDLERSFAGLVVLSFMALVWYFYKNPAKLVAILSTVIVVFFLFWLLIEWFRKKHFNNLLNKLKSSGQEDYLKNFINRFGLEGRKGEGYAFRNHKFEWDRINDLKKILKEKGVTSREKDIFTLLRFYIQEKEEQLTRESIRKEPQKLANLSGSDFERLLYRLFEAAGYKVELIGKSGDQGEDLIANREGERTLVQAKCYRDWSTGNSAVQQVGTAMKYYDCTRAMVITTSYFTPEAISLAKANNIELITKERLQELLLEYLGENWF